MTQDLPERRVGAEPGAIAARREEHRRGRRGPVQRGHTGYTGGRDGLPESSNNKKKKRWPTCCFAVSLVPLCPCCAAGTVIAILAREIKQGPGARRLAWANEATAEAGKRGQEEGPDEDAGGRLEPTVWTAES